MALSGPRSGKHAVLDKDGSRVYGISRWTLNLTTSLDDHVHSATYGAHNRLLGIEDWTGTVEGFGGNPGLFPGETFSAKFFTAPDTGVYGAAGMSYDGDCIVDSLNIARDWNAGGTIKWSASVSANGCLTTTAASDLVDTPTDCMHRMCTNVPYIDVDPCTADNYVELPNVLSANLTFTAANQLYSNSSTGCCSLRQPGTLDWTLDIVDQETNNQFAGMTYVKFKMFVSPTEFWILDSGLSTGFSNFTADVESGAIISKSNTFVMSGMYCCTNTQTVGEIVDPGTNVKWPVAPA